VTAPIAPVRWDPGAAFLLMAPANVRPGQLCLQPPNLRILTTAGRSPPGAPGSVETREDLRSQRKSDLSPETVGSRLLSLLQSQSAQTSPPLGGRLKSPTAAGVLFSGLGFATVMTKGISLRNAFCLRTLKIGQFTLQAWFGCDRGKSVFRSPPARLDRNGEPSIGPRAAAAYPNWWPLSGDHETRASHCDQSHDRS
jgi:hypothetical protein